MSKFLQILFVVSLSYASLVDVSMAKAISLAALSSSDTMRAADLLQALPKAKMQMAAAPHPAAKQKSADLGEEIPVKDLFSRLQTQPQRVLLAASRDDRHERLLNQAQELVYDPFVSKGSDPLQIERPKTREPQLISESPKAVAPPIEMTPRELKASAKKEVAGSQLPAPNITPAATRDLIDEPAAAEISERFEELLTESTWFESPVEEQVIAEQALEQDQVLQVLVSQASVEFVPSQLEIEHTGALVRVAVEFAKAPEPGQELALFVRHPSVLRWDEKKTQLLAASPGETEVYVVYQGQMHILPVRVAPAVSIAANHESENQALNFDEGLLTLNAKSLLKNSLASYQRSRPTPASPTHASAVSVLQDQVDFATQQAERIQREADVFTRSQAAVQYTAMSLQFVDDRSSGKRGELFPLADARMRIIGTDFRAKSDSRGWVIVRDLPVGARVMVQAFAPNVRPTMQEVYVSEAKQEAKLMLMRMDTFSVMEKMAGVVQDSAFASFCATAYDESTNAPRAGVQVSLDVYADGPFYFDQFGFLDRHLEHTTTNGRYCFFNVDPGAVSVSLFADELFWSMHPIGLYAGYHAEHEFDLKDGERLQVHLAATTTAREQLGMNLQAINRLRPVDAIDIAPLGQLEPMPFHDDSIMAMEEFVRHQGRGFLYTQTAEFENTLYAIDEGADHVVPLIPRGFVEDLATEYAQIAHDPVHASVLIEHALEEESSGLIEMQLLDHTGQAVGEGWYFADQPVAKAIFFNVPPGVYSVIIKTQDGFWLAADTVTAYSSTLSYVATGAKLARRSPPGE